LFSQLGDKTRACKLSRCDSGCDIHIHLCRARCFACLISWQHLRFSVSSLLHNIC